jgi:hypothetical protein
MELKYRLPAAFEGLNSKFMIQSYSLHNVRSRELSSCIEYKNYFNKVHEAESSLAVYIEYREHTSRRLQLL